MAHISTTTPHMGEAKRRRQRLGALYGTPEGSNCQIPDFVNKDKLKLLPKAHAVKHYLSLSKEEAAAFRETAAVAFLTEQCFLRQLEKLPFEFSEAFVRLLGHELVMSRERENWEQICRDLHAIADGSENRHALATWHKAENRPVIEMDNARHACYSLLQGILDEKFLNPNNVTAFACINPDSIMLADLIPDHLVSVATIEAGFLLHQSGSLYLFDTACGRERERWEDDNERLWLTRLRPDGIYAIGGHAAVGGLKPSEIKGMKQYVENYNGSRIEGKISNCPYLHTRCADICKLIGFNVNGRVAWIGK